MYNRQTDLTLLFLFHHLFFCFVIFLLALFRLQGRNIDLAHWDTISGRVVNATLLCQNGVTFCTVFTIEDSLDADNGKNEMLLIILLLSTIHCELF